MKGYWNVSTYIYICVNTYRASATTFSRFSVSRQSYRVNVLNGLDLETM